MVPNGDDRSESPSLSVIMPALDEAEGITEALDAADQELSQVIAQGMVRSFEIVLVDDGSTDATAELVAEVARRRPNVHLVRHDHNRGVGAAFRTALGQVKGELVLWTDADMPVDLTGLLGALPLLGQPGTVMVAGRRSSAGGEGRTRQVATWLYDRIMSTIAGPIPTDVNFPFKILRTADAVKLPLQTDGALLDVELCRLAQADGRCIVSLEMGYRGREAGESKTMSIRLLTKLAIELMHHRQTLRAATSTHP